MPDMMTFRTMDKETLRMFEISSRNNAKALLQALKGNTFPYPDQDGNVDTAPPRNALNGTPLTGTDALIAKTHQLMYGYKTPDMATDSQLKELTAMVDHTAKTTDHIKQKSADSFILLPYYNVERDKYEEMRLYNVRASTVEPAKLDRFIENTNTIRQELYYQQQSSKAAEYFANGKDLDMNQYGQIPPRTNKALTITSPEPAKYLGTVLAAMALNAPCACGKLTAEMFKKKINENLNSTILGKDGKSHPTPLALYKLGGEAMDECMKILKEQGRTQTRNINKAIRSNSSMEFSMA